jgi:hypothetical protein
MVSSMSRQTRNAEKGKWGEELILSLLLGIGKARPGGPADLIFEDCAVEVKTAMPSQINSDRIGFQFCLTRQGKTDFRKADILILLAATRDRQPIAVWLIDPRTIPTGQQKITILPDLSGKWHEHIIRRYGASV